MWVSLKESDIPRSIENPLFPFNSAESKWTVDLCLRIPAKASPELVQWVKERLQRLDGAIRSFIISERLQGVRESYQDNVKLGVSLFGSRPIIDKHWGASQSHGGLLKNRLLSPIPRDLDLIISACGKGISPLVMLLQLIQESHFENH